MKKIILVMMSALLLLTGCSMSEKKAYTEKLKKYESYWNAIMDNDRHLPASRFFDAEASISKISDEEGYQYAVIIDNPRIAMYNVEVLVLDQLIDYTDERMMPSAGIFDNEITMIPGQVRIDKNYVAGISVVGETKEPSIKLNVLVTWRNNSKLEVQREFLEIPVKYEEPKKEVPVTQTETPAETQTEEVTEEVED